MLINQQSYIFNLKDIMPIHSHSCSIILMHADSCWFMLIHDDSFRRTEANQKHFHILGVQKPSICIYNANRRNIHISYSRCSQFWAFKTPVVWMNLYVYIFGVIDRKINVLIVYLNKRKSLDKSAESFTNKL